jgi:hypothetical protein
VSDEDESTEDLRTMLRELLLVLPWIGSVILIYALWPWIS